MEEKDIFIRQTKYPEAEAVFSWKPRTLEKIKGDCIVVLDTNVLLIPYTQNKKNLEEIKGIYKKLVDQNRLVVPGQVAREFADLRSKKLQELHQQIGKQKSSNEEQKIYDGKSKVCCLDEYPLLINTDEYREAIRLAKEVNDEFTKLDEKVARYKQSISKLQDLIKSWYWNDPVSLIYTELFASDVVVDVPVDKAAATEDLQWRKRNSIPPGYKDSGGLGDLLIWYTIREVGKTRKKNILFVTQEAKSDWWVNSEKTSLYPRYELIDEFRRHSDGQSFHALSLSDFLGLFNASKELVDSVKQEEDRPAETITRNFVVREGYWSAGGRPYIRTSGYLLSGAGFEMSGGGGEHGFVYAQSHSPFPPGERISVEGSFSNYEHFGGCSIEFDGHHFHSRYSIDPPFWFGGEITFKGSVFTLPINTTEQNVTLTAPFVLKGAVTGFSMESPVTPVFIVQLGGTGEAKLELELGNYGEEGPLYDFESIRYEFHSV